MADRKQALQNFLENIEAGCVYGWADVLNPVSGWEEAHNLRSIQAFHGSLDAAKNLHEAVLPTMPMQMTDQSKEYLGCHGWSVSVNWPHKKWEPHFTASGPFSYYGNSETPARAWLISILKALIAQEGE